MNIRSRTLSMTAVLAAAVLSAGAAFAQADPVAEGLRTQVTGVLPKGVGVLLMAPSGQVSRLEVGDVWRDGWRLSAVSLDAATLQRDGETRVVALGGADTAAGRWPSAATFFDRVSRLGASATSEQLVSLMQEYMGAQALDGNCRAVAEPGAFRVLTSANATKPGEITAITCVGSDGRVRILTVG